MQDLHLIGVHEDGEHLLLGDGSGGEFRLRLDDAVRRAARREARATSDLPGHGAAALGPREVQAMIRGGASAEEAAERAGWTIEKVHRFDGPILAEREHIATLAVRTRLRGRYGEAGATLAERVAHRLSSRGASPESLSWDSWRAEDGDWTVVARFSAGGRAREATWRFVRRGGTLAPLDEEAGWLSAEDEPESPIPRRPGKPPGGAPETERPALATARSDGAPGDSPADPSASQAGQAGRAGQPAQPSDDARHDRSEPAGRQDHRSVPLEHAAASAPRGAAAPRATTPRAHAPRAQEAPVAAADSAPAEAATESAHFEVPTRDDAFDLMDSVRQRSSAARRRGGAARRHRVDPTPGTSTQGAGISPSALPSTAGISGDAALPLADLGYDPATMAPPPGAHSDPDAEGADGRPEPAAAEAARRARPPRPRRATRVGPPGARGGADTEPPRTKRRRPAAFPGALDPDPVEDAPVENTPVEDAPVEDAPVEATGSAALAEEEWIETAVAEGPTTPDAAQGETESEVEPADPSEPEYAEAATEPPVAVVADEPQLPWDEDSVVPVEDPSSGALSAGSDSPAPTAGLSPTAGLPPEAATSPEPVVAPAADVSPAAEAAPSPKAARDVEPALGTQEVPEAFAAKPARQTAAQKATDPAARRAGRPKGRASVPSWDDIMFGGRRE
ncbi:MAG: DUF3071 domain-containing protein [Austwickia sp.]|nr:DUF3071 domain-containing protein [Austwickia sp.]